MCFSVPTDNFTGLQIIYLTCKYNNPMFKYFYQYIWINHRHHYFKTNACFSYKFFSHTFAGNKTVKNLSDVISGGIQDSISFNLSWLLRPPSTLCNARCLSVCLLENVRNNCCTDLHENFIIDVCVYKEELIKLWKPSAFRYRNIRRILNIAR